MGSVVATHSQKFVELNYLLGVGLTVFNYFYNGPPL